MLNVYLVSGEWCVVGPAASPAPASDRQPPRTTHHAFYFLDLPGYGYAKASKTDRTAFLRLVTDALTRPRLSGVLWLLDIRRDPSAADRVMHEQFAERQTRVLAALTKSDKVSGPERVRRERELRDALELDEDQLIATSALEGTGMGELREAVWELAGSPPSRG